MLEGSRQAEVVVADDGDSSAEASLIIRLWMFMNEFHGFQGRHSREGSCRVQVSPNVA